MNIDETHPGLRQLLDAGGFSVRRTDTEYSRIPVDVTLEQTVNADAASRLTGVTASTDNYHARVRWNITKSSRAALVNEALSMVDLGNARRQEVRTDLKPSRIQRDNIDLQKLIKQIEACLNPFTLDMSLPLLNISTGRAVTDEVSNSLLSVPEVGKKRHQDFVTECKNQKNRFEMPIKKNPLKTFAKMCVVNRKAGSTSKEAQLKCTTQLLGRIAFTAAVTKIDLEHVFSFPLTPVPLSMARGDGTMAHTDKSQLFHLLEKTVADHGKPRVIGTHIVDGNFQLHCMSPDQPPKYGQISESIIRASLAYPSRRIDITFDTYERPSIKDCERDRRGAVGGCEFAIEGPAQRLPEKFKKLLNREEFKRQLPPFLVKNWSSPHLQPQIEGREIYLGVMDVCTRFLVEDGAVTDECVPSLGCNHPEADTRVILHMLHAARTTPGDIIIRASDTDILVILLHHVHRVTATVWMEVRTSGQRNRRYINVTKIAATIGPALCAALPGFHSFTGCDYTSAFVRKGKIRPYTILS